MRVLFTCAPGTGHLFPMVPLARAMAAAGHDVIVATGADMAERVEGAGLPFVPVGPTNGEITQAFSPYMAEVATLAPDDVRPFMFAKRFGAVATPLTVDSLLDTARDLRPDVVVHETAAIAAPLVAEVLGIPSVHHSFGLVPEPRAVKMGGAEVAEIWRARGLEPRDDAGLHRGLYLDVCPPSLQHPAIADVAPVQALRPGLYDGSAPGEAVDLPQGRPLVYVTLGTVGLFNKPAVFAAVLAGLADAPVQVLVTVGGNNDPAAFDAPPNTTIRTYVPQSAVLPHCDVVVAHGGSGSTLGALAHGRPMLVLPQGADQFNNAQQVAAAGAGLALLPGEATPDAIRAAVESLLGDAPQRAGAARVQAEIAAMPSAADVVPVVEALV